LILIRTKSKDFGFCLPKHTKKIILVVWYMRFKVGKVHLNTFHYFINVFFSHLAQVTSKCFIYAL
jgi:hypothetical protein